jgi:hypothetical protein
LQVAAHALVAAVVQAKSAVLAAHGFVAPIIGILQASKDPPIYVAAAVSSAMHGLALVKHAVPVQVLPLTQASAALQSVENMGSVLLRQVFAASRQPPIAVGVQTHSAQPFFGLMYLSVHIMSGMGTNFGGGTPICTTTVAGALYAP